MHRSVTRRAADSVDGTRIEAEGDRQDIKDLSSEGGTFLSLSCDTKPARAPHRTRRSKESRGGFHSWANRRASLPWRRDIPDSVHERPLRRCMPLLSCLHSTGGPPGTAHSTPSSRSQQRRHTHFPQTPHRVGSPPLAGSLPTRSPTQSTSGTTFSCPANGDTEFAGFYPSPSHPSR